MAKGGRTAFFVLLLLSTLAQCALGQNTFGTIHVSNGADFDMTIINGVHFVDGSTHVDPAFTPVPKQTTWLMDVAADMDTVTTEFRMVTDAAQPSYQVIVDWSTIAGAMKVLCIPDCWWVVDNQGFSVAGTEHAQLTFVAGWVQFRI